MPRVVCSNSQGCIWEITVSRLSQENGCTRQVVAPHIVSSHFHRLSSPKDGNMQIPENLLTSGSYYFITFRLECTLSSKSGPEEQLFVFRLSIVKDCYLFQSSYSLMLCRNRSENNRNIGNNSVCNSKACSAQLRISCFRSDLESSLSLCLFCLILHDRL